MILCGTGSMLAMGVILASFVPPSTVARQRHPCELHASIFHGTGLVILALVSSWRAPRYHPPRHGGAIIASLHAFVLHGADLMKKMTGVVLASSVSPSSAARDTIPTCSAPSGTSLTKWMAGALFVSSPS